MMVICVSAIKASSLNCGLRVSFRHYFLSVLGSKAGGACNNTFYYMSIHEVLLLPWRFGTFWRALFLAFHGSEILVKNIYTRASSLSKANWYHIFKACLYFHKDEEESVKLNRVPAKSNRVPTGRIVGILRRKWRPYCGILAPSTIKEVCQLYLIILLTPFLRNSLLFVAKKDKIGMCFTSRSLIKF